MPNNEAADPYVFTGTSDKVTFGPFPPILPVRVDVPTGWECPRCERIYSPRVEQCAVCSPPEEPRRLQRPVGGPGCPGCAADRESRQAEADQPARVSVDLPAYMAEPGHRHVAKIGRKWRELFPGMEASLGSFRVDGENAEAVIDFRLTPPGDGERRD